MIPRKSSPRPIDRAIDTGVAPRHLVRADTSLGSLAIAAALVLAAAQVAGCTRPDERAVRPNDDGTSIVNVERSARPEGGGTSTPVATPSIVPTDDIPRLAGEPAPVSPATATAPASASGSGSAKPPTPPPTPNPDPPPLPGKIAPVRPGNDRI